MIQDTLTVAQALHHQARANANRVAVQSEQAALTFRQLFDRGAALADSLQLRGMKAGDRIGILSPNSLAYLETYVACEVGGFVAAPLNDRLSYPEWSQVLRNASAKTVVFDAERVAAARSLGNDHPLVELWVELEGPDYHQMIEFGDASRAAAAVEQRGSEEVVYLIHTSGTTGHPKGAMLTQGAQLKVAQAIAGSAGLDEHDLGLIVQPLFHVGAKFLQLAHLVAGAGIVLQRHFDPKMIWKALGTQPITTLQLAPTMLEMVLAQAPEVVPQKLKALFYSAAPMRESLLRQAMDIFGSAFVQHYGSTEAGVVTTLAQSQHKPDGSAQEQSRLRSAGTASATTQLKVVDERGCVAEPGQTGEILVKHDCLFAGYWRNPKATASAMEDGWLKMGDVGFLDEDGYLFIVDRKNDLIISGGENIYPREVENALLSHPAVDDCAVVGAPDKRWGETVVAEVVLRDPSSASAVDLIEHCRNKIASYKKPTRVVFREQLPRLANGKIDKVKIRREYWRDSERQV